MDKFDSIKEAIISAKAMIKSRDLLCDAAIKKNRSELFNEVEKRGIASIPIFIISYNRLSYIEQMIKWLEERGLKNIHIIDNASTYPPLLDYYNHTAHKVHYLDKNYGYMAFWKCSDFDQYRDYFYVVTDPDLCPVNNCPHDFLTFFLNVLKKYPGINKVGFSLKISDIPDCNNMKESIIEWESPFYKRKFPFQNLYFAGIDTTFALYMPRIVNTSDTFYRAIRTGDPYQVMHLPWYKAQNDITEEDIYYSEHKENGWWDVTKSSVSDEGANTEAWKEIFS